MVRYNKFVTNYDKSLAIICKCFLIIDADKFVCQLNFGVNKLLVSITDYITDV